MPASRELVSVTLTGNAAPLVGDALASVLDWVDGCLIVDTGSTDGTLDIARSVAGSKYIERRFPWIDDFAAARNFALAAAHDAGAAWAMVLDTDERMVLGRADLRPLLRGTNVDVYTVMHDSGVYAKERFFRLPARGHYVGPTHECYIRSEEHSEEMPGLRFREIPKGEEESRRKFERDLRILGAYSAQHPDDPRWLYYLGDTLQNLSRHEEAILAYRRCASLDGWDEQAAWACYRAAECAIILGRPAEAVELCSLGLAKHAGIAELCWLAAYASWTIGKMSQAVAWSRLSVAMGNARGPGARVQRSGFRNPHALYEGPFDVLRFALRALGDEEGAAQAERDHAEATALRRSLEA